MMGPPKKQQDSRRDLLSAPHEKSTMNKNNQTKILVPA